MRPSPSFILRFALAALAGCASHAPSGAPGASQLQVDQAAAIVGVPDDGRDPAVLAIDVGSGALCSGALVAPDLVMTARDCVSLTVDSVACPPAGAQILGARDAASLRVFASDDARSVREVARGASVVAPDGDALCDADIAFLLLDRSLSIVPLVLARVPVATGAHVTTVGFGRRTEADPPGTKLLREHVEVLSGSSAEFLVGGAPCEGSSGGPALDESTGAIVGVVARGGSTCDGTDVHDVYTRPTAFLPLFSRALALSAWAIAEETSDGGAGDAGAVSTSRVDAGAPKPPTDVGSPCVSALDCGAGVCITDEPKTYCSRSCGTGDRCPDHYHCTTTAPSQKVCVQAT